jgi:hypothetical protein
MTLNEYEDVRAQPTHFLIIRGHIWHPELERVVRETERFEVVEKHGDAGDAANRGGNHVSPTSPLL